MLAFFHRVAPGAIASDLREAYSASATALGFIAALYFYPYAAMQLPSGVLADSIGPRKLFTAGSLVAGAGSLVFAFAPTTAWLLLGRGLVGLGVAVAFVSVLKLIASWYRENEFGTWVGLLMLIGNLGGVLATYPLAWASQHVSWRIVFAATGIVSLALAAGTWFGVRDNPRTVGLPSLHPEDAGAAHAGWWEGLRAVCATRYTWFGFAMHLGMIGSFLTFSGLWAVPYLTSALGMERGSATLHVTVTILGFAAASLLVGAASDRVGRRIPALRALSLLYLACWMPWVAGWQPPAALSFAVFALMGVGIAGASLAWALAKELNPPALAGTATSVVNTGGFLGTALFQPLVGWVLDRSGGDYSLAAAILALIALTGVGAAFLMPETRCRNVWAQRNAGAA